MKISINEDTQSDVLMNAESAREIFRTQNLVEEDPSEISSVYMPRECRAILEDVDESKKSRAAKIVKQVNLASAQQSPPAQVFSNLNSIRVKSPSPERGRSKPTAIPSSDNFPMIQNQEIKQLASMIIPMA